MLERKSVPQEAADYLRNRILEGELKPGTPLREGRIAAELQISRNTLREAIRILAADGLVHLKAHHSSSVAAVSEEDIRDIYLARRAIEPAALRAVTAGRLPRELKEIAEQLEAALREEDLDRIAQLDMEFHCTLVDALGSRRLSDSFRALMTELRLAFMLLERAIAGTVVPDLDEHAKMLRLIEAGNLETLLEVHAAHLNRGERSLIDLVRSVEPRGDAAAG